MKLEVIVLPIALGVFLGFLIVLPLVRQRIRVGRWAVVVRNRDPGIENFVRWWTVLLLVGIAAWSVLVATMSPETLGIWNGPELLRWIGVGSLALGFLIVAIGQAQMGSSWRIGIDDEPTDLVTTGLYRWVRHPIYSGILAMFIGVAVLTPSAWTATGLAFGFVMIGLQSRLEEDHVQSQHRETFAAWASQTGRFFPGLGRLPVGGA